MVSEQAAMWWVAHVIIVSAPVQRNGFWGFSFLVRKLGQDFRDCWDGGLGLGLGLDNIDIDDFVQKDKTCT